MKQALYLPQELWRDILQRLSIKSILTCKSVCKSWRDLIQGEGGLFATSYTPKGMAFLHRDKMGYAVCDEACQPIVRFRLPPPHDQYHDHDETPAYHRVIIGSVNGLLFLWDGWDEHHNILFVVNPMTSECIQLPPRSSTHRCLFGFGVTKLSGQYKVLCVDESGCCDVYTLGGGNLWRNIPTAVSTRLAEISKIPNALLDYTLFFNGNLHWPACDLKNNFVVCCFDLETELFTSFSLPPLTTFTPPPRNLRYTIDNYGSYRLCVLEDQLCLCDTSHHSHVTIWKMNNYRDSNSWIIEYSFEQPPNKSLPSNVHSIVLPLKVLTNGDLLTSIDSRLLIYSKDTGAFRKYGLLRRSFYCNMPSITHYITNFFSLTAMGISNIKLLNSY